MSEPDYKKICDILLAGVDEALDVKDASGVKLRHAVFINPENYHAALFSSLQKPLLAAVEEAETLINNPPQGEHNATQGN